MRHFAFDRRFDPQLRYRFSLATSPGARIYPFQQPVVLRGKFVTRSLLTDLAIKIQLMDSVTQRHNLLHQCRFPVC